MPDTSISAAELYETREPLRIIDIRKVPDDRQIPGAEIRNGESLLTETDPPFTTEERIVLYCGSGNSCRRIAATLRERGYNAQYLDGGYTAWSNADLPTEPRDTTA